MISCTFSANTVKSTRFGSVMPKNPTICVGKMCTSAHSATAMTVAPATPHASVFLTREYRRAP